MSTAADVVYGSASLPAVNSPDAAEEAGSAEAGSASSGDEAGGAPPPPPPSSLPPGGDDDDQPEDPVYESARAAEVRCRLDTIFFFLKKTAS
jgi:hypothetical protein